MTYVEKIYRFSRKVRQILTTKLFKNVFMIIISMFLFFGVMNVYAQEESPKVSADWTGTKEYYNLASGTEKDEDNMTSHSGQLSMNTAWVIFSTIAPEFTIGGDDIQASNTISPDMKGGVLGFTKTAYANVYVNQPRIDVLAHLQKEWVPGADATDTSLYAASDTQNGYDTLMDSGISPLWAQFRNLAYLFFVVIMMVIGFMIMFRSKIGGQTMVTLGNTIPDIIISLLMITFSFAIAGIIIDVGGLLVSLLYSIFDQKGVAINDIGQFYEMFAKGIGAQFVDVVKEDFTDSFQTIISSPISGLIKLVTAYGKAQFVGLIGTILMILGSGIVLVGAIKLLITLYKAYFELILNVVIGPIKILMGTLPGNGAMRINWVTGIMRSVLVFPIAYFIVNIPIYLAEAGNVVLSLPEKLTGANLVDTAGSLDLNTGEGYLGILVTFILRVFVLFYACQAPKFAEAIIPVKETNRAVGDAMAGAKTSMSKVPLVGSLFK